MYGHVMTELRDTKRCILDLKQIVESQPHHVAAAVNVHADLDLGEFPPTSEVQLVRRRCEVSHFSLLSRKSVLVCLGLNCIDQLERW
jgi:hypothetical protein